MVTTNTVPLV